MSIDAIKSEITALENQRMQCLMKKDWTALAAMIADDYVHIHATGLIDDKASYLEGAKTKLEFQRVERKSLNISVEGDVVITTGVVDQTLKIIGPDTVVDLGMAATQVWVKRDGRWLIRNFQNTRLP